MQQKQDSFLEAIVSTVCGLILIILVSFIVKVTDLYASLDFDLALVWIVLILSIAKNYIVRRACNYVQTYNNSYKNYLTQIAPYFISHSLDGLTGHIEAKKSGKKYDEGKIRWDLLPVVALEKIAEVLTFGASKYGEWNWLKGIDYNRLYRASLGHLHDWWDINKDNNDHETGIPHLAHAGCCILFLLSYEVLGLVHLDNREETQHKLELEDETTN